MQVDSKIALGNPFAGLHDYKLDRASLIPALALGVRAGDRVADLCSAPGGKLLVMIFFAAREGFIESCRFVAHDLSPARVQRLKAVLHDCLPPLVLSYIDVRRGDAARFGLKFAGQFDRVLADVPCSGKDQEQSSKRLAVRQHAILCAALDSVRLGGRVVYSTCTESAVENDGVVAKLLRSREGLFRVVPVAEWWRVAMAKASEYDFDPDHASGLPTEFGCLVTPETAACGPIYTAVLERLA